MRIVITDNNYIWHHQNPLLKQFKDILLVVCLDGRKVTDEYECFVSPFKANSLEMDCGVGGQKLLALESVAERLNSRLNYHQDIVFLADNAPESLYPYFALKDLNEYNRFHLCAIKPFKFEPLRVRKAYAELLQDLRPLSSFLYWDPDEQLAVDNKVNSEGFQKEYESLLPRVLNQIHHCDDWSKKYFFDFKTMEYILVDEGFKAIDLDKKIEEVNDIDFKVDYRVSTLGVIMHRFFPQDDDETRESVEQLVPRVDGKQICNMLREKRIELARLNNIQFESELCPSKGPCAGTCQKCDEEAAYLRDELNKIPKEKRVYPELDLQKEGF